MPDASRIQEAHRIFTCAQDDLAQLRIYEEELLRERGALRHTLREILASGALKAYPSLAATAEALTRVDTILARAMGPQCACPHANTHHEGSLGEFCDHCGAPV